jgi:hypothetical protein
VWNAVTHQTRVAPAFEIVETLTDVGMLQQRTQLLVDGIDRFGMGRHPTIVLRGGGQIADGLEIGLC